MVQILKINYILPQLSFVCKLRLKLILNRLQVFFNQAKIFLKSTLGLTLAAERHPNVLSLVGFCLEKPPLLLLHEFCVHGDLKTFLRANRGKTRIQSYDLGIYSYNASVVVG
jgi:hypothetical protein